MVESGRVGSKMVKLRVDMRVYTEKFQFFNVKYHAIIEIVECESGRVAKKWSSASRLCEYAGTRPFPTVLHHQLNFLKQYLFFMTFQKYLLLNGLVMKDQKLFLENCFPGFFFRTFFLIFCPL